MSDNANANTTLSTSTAQASSQLLTSSLAQPTSDDAKSFTSDTATLYDSQDVKSKESKSAMNTALESSTGFSQKAKEEGWGSPTATRPTFNG